MPIENKLLIKSMMSTVDNNIPTHKLKGRVAIVTASTDG